MTEWFIYRGEGVPHGDIATELPTAPPWRSFAMNATERRLGRATAYRASQDEIELVNAALYLRRPLLVTGKPGVGKSTLAHSVAQELSLGPVLRWPISSRSTLQEGLYKYDAIARLQDTSLWSNTREGNAPDIGRYLRLGPLGTAFLPTNRPRVVLIDELDKSDIDLPNDLLNIFEEGEYEIPELMRVVNIDPNIEVTVHDDTTKVTITRGSVRCNEFPLVVITSNGERDFSPAFLRRCLQLRIQAPDHDRLVEIVRAHMPEAMEQSEELINDFISRRMSAEGDLATDQLLNAIYLRFHHAWPNDRDRLIQMTMQSLRSTAV